ncbi:MAG TPA: hypothetical protein VFG10_04665 [Saprospiraceae bacterium]|nr:hypothetical protein [Saprospiraceae bacterium]
MREEYYMPIWIKALLAFLLVMLGILFTFIMYRFFPVPKETGFDGLGSLMYIFFILGALELVFIFGVMFLRKHPYSLFSTCLLLFLVGLILIRWLVIGS